MITSSTILSAPIGEMSLAFRCRYASTTVGTGSSVSNTDYLSVLLPSRSCFPSLLKSMEMYEAMRPVTVGWIVDAVQGILKQGRPETLCAGVSTDSRSIKAGELFWALQGQRFDGHDFITDVVAQGSAAIVVGKGRAVPSVKESVAVIEVSDTLWALGSFAARYRHLYAIPIVAVTGSTGKTTTKEMIAAILSVQRRVHRNEGNLNNLIGLPLSLAQLTPQHEAGVFELGMNRKGEIARLTEIADPTVGIVTNIGPVHLEYLGSVEAVAEAKGELFQKLSTEAVAVINNDDQQIVRLGRSFSGKRMTFGISHAGDVSASEIVTRGTAGIAFIMKIGQETIPITLRALGRHNVMNALAAAAVATTLGESPATIAAGLARFRNIPLRQELMTIGNHVTVINDCYNANPVSMEAALATFSQVRGNAQGILILGDMLELGPEASLFHYELGARAARLLPDYLFILGDYGPDVKAGALDAGQRPESIFVAKMHQDIRNMLLTVIKESAVILVKGSRGMRMERIVEGITDERHHAPVDTAP